MAGGIDSWGGGAEAKKGEKGGALFGPIGGGGLDGDMELSIGEDEVVGEGSVGTKADGASIDGDVRAGGGSSIEDEFGVDVHGESTFVAEGAGGQTGGSATGGEFFEAATKRLGNFQGADAGTEDEVTSEIVENTIGHTCGDNAA